MLKESHYDVCLLDSSLGSKGGIEFIRESKANQIKTPIIYLADASARERDVTALRAGAADYLVKGHIHPVFLQRAIRYALERYHSEQQSTEPANLNNNDTPNIKMCRELEGALTKLTGQIKLIQKKQKSLNGVNHLLEDSFNTSLAALAQTSTLLKSLTLNDTIAPDVNIHQVVQETVNWLSPLLPKNATLNINTNRKNQFIIDGSNELIRELISGVILFCSEQTNTENSISIELSVDDDTPHYAALKIKAPAVSLMDYSNPFNSTSHNLTGLLLSAIPDIIQLHNAWFVCEPLFKDEESGEQSGFLFSCYFHLSSSDKTHITNTYQPSQRGEILVIEDDGSFASLTKLYLDAAGVDSKIFIHPTEALAWYATHTQDIDLVLFDSNLSDLSGEECFSILKKINPNIIAAVFSTEPSTDAKKLLGMGAKHYFQKPMHYPLIIAWIMEELSNRKR